MTSKHKYEYSELNMSSGYLLSLIVTKLHHGVFHLCKSDGNSTSTESDQNSIKLTDIDVSIALRQTWNNLNPFKMAIWKCVFYAEYSISQKHRWYCHCYFRGTFYFVTWWTWWEGLLSLKYQCYGRKDIHFMYLLSWNQRNFAIHSQKRYLNDWLPVIFSSITKWIID